MRIEIFELSESVPETDCKASTASPWGVEIESFFNHLHEAGIELQRYGLDRDPLAFAAHAGIADLLDAKGNGALPAIFIDGRLVGHGRPLQVAAVKKALVVRGVRF